MANASISNWLEREGLTADAVCLLDDGTALRVEIKASNGELMRVAREAHHGDQEKLELARQKLQLEQSRWHNALSKANLLTPIRDLDMTGIETVSKKQPICPAIDTIEAYQIRSGKLSLNSTEKLLVRSLAVISTSIARVYDWKPDYEIIRSGNARGLIESKLARHAARSTIKTALPDIYTFGKNVKASLSIQNNITKVSRAMLEPDSNEANTVIRAASIMEPKISKPLKVDAATIVALSIRDLCAHTNTDSFQLLMKSQTFAPNSQSKTLEYIATAQFLGGILSQARECRILDEGNIGTSLSQEALDTQALYESTQQNPKQGDAVASLEMECAKKLSDLHNLSDVKVLDAWYTTHGKDLLNTPIDEEKTLKHPFKRPVRMENEVLMRAFVATQHHEKAEVSSTLTTSKPR